MLDGEKTVAEEKIVGLEEDMKIISHLSEQLDGTIDKISRIEGETVHLLYQLGVIVRNSKTIPMLK